MIQIPRMEFQPCVIDLTIAQYSPPIVKLKCERIETELWLENFHECPSAVLRRKPAEVNPSSYKQRSKITSFLPLYRHQVVNLFHRPTLHTDKPHSPENWVLAKVRFCWICHRAKLQCHVCKETLGSPRIMPQVSVKEFTASNWVDAFAVTRCSGTYFGESVCVH